jgi:hypothetical protein
MNHRGSGFRYTILSFILKVSCHASVFRIADSGGVLCLQAIRYNTFGIRGIKLGNSYYFSQIGGIWDGQHGQWQKYDRHREAWPLLRRDGMLAEIFDQSKEISCWTGIWDASYENRGRIPGTISGLITGFTNNSLVIVPSVNLVSN